MTQNLKWKDDWAQAQQILIKWWNGEGLAVSMSDAHRNEPLASVSQPTPPDLIEDRWIDPGYRCAKAEYDMANRLFPAETFPYFDTEIGPGSLGTFLGAQPNFSEETIWYESCIVDLEQYGAIAFETDDNHWWDVHLALIEEGVKRANGRYLVGIPDLIENIDTLHALRGDDLLYDLIDRPGWVQERLREITDSWTQAFGLLYDKVRDDGNGNAYAAFQIWGPGKTAKIQCDFSVMISPAMYREFVLPHLVSQCQYLDYAMYHLDGTNAIQHLDAILEIDELQAVEWTPQAGLPQGGSPRWFDLYRRIKQAGKSVQALSVQPNEVVPLLDAIGPEGTFIWITDPISEAEVESVLKSVEAYR